MLACDVSTVATAQHANTLPIAWHAAEELSHPTIGSCRFGKPCAVLFGQGLVISVMPFVSAENDRAHLTGLRLYKLQIVVLPSPHP